VPVELPIGDMQIVRALFPVSNKAPSKKLVEFMVKKENPEKTTRYGRGQEPKWEIPI
jgi:hypothetical protein